MVSEIKDVTAWELRRLTHRKWDESIEFDSMVILPARFDWVGAARYGVKLILSRVFKSQGPDVTEVDHLHDSGSRCMDFVAVRDNEAICLLSGCSDAIHVDGIGGFGKGWLEKYGTVPETVSPSGWMMDCLPVSGLLRIWSGKGKMTCGPSLPSFEIYALEGEKSDETVAGNAAT